MKTEQELDQAIARLAVEQQPQRDLWPELAVKLAQTTQIQPEITDKVQHSSVWRWVMAAAASLLIIVSLQPGIQPISTEPVNILAPQSAAEMRVASSTVWRLTSDFERKKAAQLAQLSAIPLEYADWKLNLSVWQQAANQVQQALANQPDDPELLKQLARLQQQQIAYIAKLVQSSQLS